MLNLIKSSHGGLLYNALLGSSVGATSSTSLLSQHLPTVSVGGVAGVRWKHSKRVNTRVQRLVEGGVQYPGFTYFPRHPDHKDPPCEPAKLFMVKRIRTLMKTPYWEKNIMRQLKLEDRRSTAIVKNTPTNNAMLYKVKHLIEIKPITMPYGMPDDPKNGFLKENGEFISYNLLESHQIQLEEAKEKNEEMKKKSVDGETLKNRLRQNWYSRW